MIQDQISFSLSRFYGEKNKATIVTRIILALLVLLILLTPLPFGSVQPGSIFVIEAVSGLCFLLWIIKLVYLGDRDELDRFREVWKERRKARKRGPFFSRHIHIARTLNILTFGRWPSRNTPHSGELLGLELVDTSFPYYSFFGYPVKNTGLEAAALIFLFLLFLQVIPLPKLLVSILSPTAGEFYSSAAEASGLRKSFHPLSLNSYFTVSRLFQYSAYFMIYLVSVNLIRTRGAYRAVVYALIASAVFQAGYGMYQLFSGHQEIFEYEKKFFLNCATGTFINRNHFAPYIGLSLPLIFALLASGTGLIRPTTGDWMVRISRMLENQGGKVIFRLVLIGCILAAVFFSFSLTGVIAVSIGCAMFFILFQKIRRKSMLLLFCGFVIAAIAAGYLGSGFLKERLGGLELISERSRFAAWKDTATIFSEFPIAGSGSGTFAEVFPAYRTFHTQATFSHAHNELLEFLSENGIVVLFCIFIAARALFFHLLRTLRIKNPRGMHLMQIACFSSVVILLSHNFVDFSFEIPAVAVSGMAVLALFYADYHEKNEPTKR